MKLLIILLLLQGCTSTAVFTENPEDNTWTATVTGNAEAEMKTDELEMKIKRKPLIQTPDIGDIKFIKRDD